MHHDLKIESDYFKQVACGDKTFEIRYNDRGYQKGDTICLNEIIVGSRTGGKIDKVITYVTNYQQKPEWVVFGIANKER